jgi:DNA-binding NarL/FixJ family response regulator
MSTPCYRLLLIDPDPIFRLGLRTWLNAFAELDIVAEADTAEQALQILARTDAPAASEKLASQIFRKPLLGIDLVMIGIDSTQGPLNFASALTLCQHLKTQYPSLPILVLDFPQNRAELPLFFKKNVEGYCLKGQSPEEIVTAIRQVASGQTYWSNLDQNRNVSTQPSVFVDSPVSVWGVVKQNLYWSGVRHIDAALDRLKAEQKVFSSSTTDLVAKAILAGRVRELLAARWLISHLWQFNGDRSHGDVESSISQLMTEDVLGQRSLQVVPNLSRGDRQLTNVKAIQLSLFETIVTKLQDDLTNLTSTPLEIDILRESQKRELLYIILRQFENSLSELRFAQTQLHQISEKQPTVLHDIWQLSLTEFFGKYFTLTSRKKENVNVVNILLQDANEVAATTLNKIPQVAELLSHLLFKAPLIIDSQPYEFGTTEAMHRAEVLLDNLLIQVANAVVQPLLNQFADVEAVKQKFYTYNLMASREIERFRNDLSWKYRLEQFVNEPQAIFESRYILWSLAAPGLTKVPIYAPRTYELQQLQGIRLAVTLALELQDAIAPRLRSAVSFLGSGVVYVLTNVVGRGIGLIGRGFLQGIGSAWDENRFRHKGRRSQ